jgi:precorrin-3B synthase
MSAFARRGACPALSTPMQTGDGLLARLNTIAGGLPPKALIGLCESALRHGNGIVEVTARGSIQIRGLTPQSAQALARDVDALEIEVRSGVPVETGPLAGIDAQEISDPRPLANEIRAAIEKAGLGARLGPKVSVVVDGGGLLPMDGVSADVRLTACGDMPAWRLAIGGTAASARPLGFVNEAQACAATAVILDAIAALGREARARDLDAQHIAERIFLSGLPAISPTGREKSGLNAGSAFAALETGERAFQTLVSSCVGEMAGKPERGNPQAPPTNTPIATFPLVDGTYALGIALRSGARRDCARRNRNPPRPIPRAAVSRHEPRRLRNPARCRHLSRFHHRCVRPAPVDRRLSGGSGLRFRPDRDARPGRAYRSA